MIAIGKLDIGKVRNKNEDAIFVSNTKVGPLPNLYVVADGMGGHNAGDVASQIAIQEFCNYLKLHSNSILDTEEEILLFMKTSILHANHIVYQMALKDVNLQGMGTTFSACSVVDNKLYIVHVGDTRIYLVNKTEIKQATTDHSLVQEMLSRGYISSSEAKSYPQRNMITRAIGTYNKVKVDTFMYDLQEVEYVLLCSDGLTSMLSDEQIHEIIYKSEGSLEEIANQLIWHANSHGGKDNIAVVIGMNKEVINNV